MNETASFGFRDVDADDKQGLVDDVFARVADRYDLMNDIMSAGVHRVWKDALVAMLAAPRQSALPFAVMDIAGGTGDIALRIVESSSAHVTVADISREMLAVGRERAAALGQSERIAFVEANAEHLPFANAAFDAATIAFGIRNVPNIEAALAEAFRVLKPGGRFLCLEFSHVDIALLDRLYELYSFNLIPLLGEWVVGDAESYRYLVESIRRFPNRARFAAMIDRAGFARLSVRNLTGGVATIHSGWKL
jgi:demethylmenaquinone methyltransferase/2-methoxy-6-polyprenyl-1,4-benzoquinol methylase